MKPRALDLFCGGGGAALGLIEVGFDVVGVDSDWRCGRVYPGDFVRADAVGELAWSLAGAGAFDLIWASPPCLAHSTAARMRPARRRPECLIEETRMLLDASGGTPSVIENVAQAPLRRDLVLTGPMVGLDRLYRLRVFELGGWTIPNPPKPMPKRGSIADGTLVTVTRQGGIADRKQRAARRANGLNPNRHTLPERISAMGLPVGMGLTESMVGNAVPPAYARWIGERFLKWRSGQRGRWPRRAGRH